MTFRDALESKFPFRLAGQTDFLILNKEEKIVKIKVSTEPVFVSYEDRLSDLWEIMALSDGETKV